MFCKKMVVEIRIGRATSQGILKIKAKQRLLILILAQFEKSCIIAINVSLIVISHK